MIRPSVNIDRVFIYRKFVDFRKQVNGLSAIVQYTLKHNPMSGDLYVFFNRKKDKVRIIYWERNGYVLYSKYLEKDTFSLPDGNSDQICITGEQLNWLLDGININYIKPHSALHFNTGHLK